MDMNLFYRVINTNVIKNMIDFSSGVSVVLISLYAE